MAYPHKWSPISYKSSTGQRKHAGQRPMLYRWTTQPREWAKHRALFGWVIRQLGSSVKWVWRESPDGMMCCDVPWRLRRWRRTCGVWRPSTRCPPSTISTRLNALPLPLHLHRRSMECIPPWWLHCIAYWSAGRGQYVVASRNYLYKRQSTIKMYRDVKVSCLSQRGRATTDCFTTVQEIAFEKTSNSCRTDTLMTTFMLET